MAITSFKEIHSGRDGGDELGRDGRIVRRYTRVFRVTTDSNYDEAATILAHWACPRVGSRYSGDVGAYCRRVRPRNESFSKRVWIVTAAYSSEAELQENPLQEAADINWNTEQFQQPYVKDKDNNAILNSAGYPYDPPVEDDDSRWTATVRKNVAAVPSWLLEYRDAVCSDTFVLDGLTIKPNEAKMQAISISNEQERNEVVYRVLTMRISLKYDDRQHGVAEDNAVFKGWTRQILDAGFYDGSDDPCRDNHGNPVTAPVPLDGAGNQLANPTPATVKYQTYDILRRKPFEVLPLS